MSLRWEKRKEHQKETCSPSLPLCLGHVGSWIRGCWFQQYYLVRNFPPATYLHSNLDPPPHKALVLLNRKLLGFCDFPKWERESLGIWGVENEDDVFCEGGKMLAGWRLHCQDLRAKPRGCSHMQLSKHVSPLPGTPEARSAFTWGTAAATLLVLWPLVLLLSNPFSTLSSLTGVWRNWPGHKLQQVLWRQDHFKTYIWSLTFKCNSLNSFLLS